MNLPGEQFLAGTALTANERGAFPASDGGDEFAQPPHGRMFAHHRSVRGFLLQLRHCSLPSPPLKFIEMRKKQTSSREPRIWQPYERAGKSGKLIRRILM